MESTMGRGEIILVKSFPNDPVVRRIVEENDDWVKLCLEDEFSLWRDKGIKPEAVKCPRFRVFYYDEELYRKLEEAAYLLRDNNLLEALWNQAKNYYGTIKKNRSRAKHGA
jgi:hypothetical protein